MVKKISKDTKYNPTQIEAKWRSVWEKQKLYSPDLLKAKKPYYNLMMFPYPSAEGLHAGNMYAFTGADIWGRYQKMKGFNIFQPIGLDGFGIHSENYAIKIGKHPREVSQTTEARYYSQLKVTGIAYDWEHTLETYDIDYYRWTQWIFVQMFKKGLAYRQKAKVNWCPSCKTVLADEQVIAEKCERCASEVEKRDLEQWFFKITDYADRLLSGLDKIDWTEKVKIAQRNWIGKKEGIEIEYEIEGMKDKVKVFTTRPDTNFGATFIVLAPEHELIEKIMTSENKKVISKYIKDTQNKSNEERIAQGREKTGVFTGSYAMNNLTGEKMPIWVSDFVLSGFGTGAVVGVPGHDVRDFEFAIKFDLPIKRVVVGKDGDESEITFKGQVQEEDGTMINSGFLDGLDIHKATLKIMDYLEEKGWGKKITTYHLRDWLISRQRYWGPPIPMIYCEKCAKGDHGERGDMPGWYPVSERNLPVKLPFVENFKPTGTGEAPLAQDKDFVNVKCPYCGARARRETDVSDTFLDSAWYYLRYLATDFDNAPFPSVKFSNQERGSWLPVSMYIGGAEHSVLHLMYVRFVTMVLHDLGFLNFEEPFPKFYAHGLLIKEGKKMSKSRGNVIVPDEYINKYGADTLRSYLMFLAPFNQGGDFRDSGIEGMNRFLNRVWRLVQESGNQVSGVRLLDKQEFETRIVHKAIKRVTEDLNDLRYNRALAGIMEYVNSLEELEEVSLEAKKIVLQLLAPFAPHLTEELWEFLGETGSIHVSPWPQYEENLIQEEVILIPVQVNGKLRGTIEVDRDSAGDSQKVEKLAKEHETVAKYLMIKPKKVIFVPGKLINFVI